MTIVAGAVLVAGGIALVAIPIGQEKNEQSMHGEIHAAPNGIGGTF